MAVSLASVVKQTRLTRRARQLQWTLINFEGVKLFNNEKYEIAQYDTHLRNYGKSFKITISLAFLNSGQNVIFASALTAAMFLAAQGVVQGTMIVGDLVMVNQLTLQLTLLLNFLGTIYRETRQNLLDMETLVTLVNNNTPLIRPLPNLSH
ncbi:Iron-sulfur clusters transporter ATM1, mitochondrial [Leucoagaricus sp. SymC.cos]|nr:Iron-sulfur clusters transporter ATM1, mitochondrial [Leucoagaricus sp. SymC.cos]